MMNECGVFLLFFNNIGGISTIKTNSLFCIIFDLHYLFIK
jgi:hypothetical protein